MNRRISTGYMGFMMSVKEGNYYDEFFIMRKGRIWVMNKGDWEYWYGASNLECFESNENIDNILRNYEKLLNCC